MFPMPPPDRRTGLLVLVGTIVVTFIVGSLCMIGAAYVLGWLP